ncbi:ATP-dependent DNA helicase pif1-like [Diachasmimorpha longicaudata]|uniref:ATP-dependent DNA helicase pif1-like n=1 Tax=Diachasmimorpha longicaudata TaxID=58733 RepID=UPI0030B8F039
MIVLLCAPSGNVAFLINGITLHTAFSLPCQQFGSNIWELSSDVANTIREKLAKLQLIIIDEISMVASTVFGFIDTRMRQMKGVNEPFGGVSVLAVGDLNQLPPVLDKPVYQMSKKNEMAGFFVINPFWAPFQCHESTEIMRQKDDLPFINALNNLAHGKMTVEDISFIRTKEVMHDTDVPATAIRFRCRKYIHKKYSGTDEEINHPMFTYRSRHK